MSVSPFEKNLQALRQTHPHLASKLESLNHASPFSVVKTKNGEVNISLKLSPNETGFYYPISAEKSSEVLLKQLSLKNPRVIIFKGLGLGLHVLEYARKPHPINRALVIIEPFWPLFRLAMESVDLSPLLSHPAVHLYIGQEENELAHFYARFFSNTQNLRYAQAIDVVELPESKHFSSDFFEAEVRVRSAAIGHQFNLHYGTPYDSYRGAKNFLVNGSNLFSKPSLESARGLFKGKPGVLVASGPSLEKSLPYLKEIQNHVVLIPCLSSLPALHRAGIEPSIWLDIEREKDDITFMQGLTQKKPHVFIGTPLIDPGIFEAGHDLISYFFTGVMSPWLNQAKPILKIGHSAAHAAFALLSYFGCEDIYMVGQDLCYDEEKSHASDTWDVSSAFHKTFRESQTQSLFVPGNHGQPVELNLYWHTFMRSFVEDMFPSHQGSIYNVIPADKGVHLEGTKRIDPEALLTLKESETFSVYQVLSSALKDDVSLELSAEFAAKKLHGSKVLRRLIDDSDAFALRSRGLQYETPVFTKDWEKTKPLYEAYNKELEAFFGRFQLDSSYKDDFHFFINFFHPVVQGRLLKGFIEYFSTSKDFDGDFEAINFKLLLQFEMAKDVSFWARQLLRLFEVL